MVRDGRLALESDRLIKIFGLKDQSAGGDYINDATVTLTLYDNKKDDSGEAIEGATDLSATYITGTDGDYEVIVPHSVTLTRNTTYYGYVKAVKESTQWVAELELEGDYI